MIFTPGSAPSSQGTQRTIYQDLSQPSSKPAAAALTPGTHPWGGLAGISLTFGDKQPAPPTALQMPDRRRRPPASPQTPGRDGHRGQSRPRGGDATAGQNDKIWMCQGGKNEKNLWFRELAAVPFSCSAPPACVGTAGCEMVQHHLCSPGDARARGGRGLAAPSAPGEAPAPSVHRGEFVSARQHSVHSCRKHRGFAVLYEKREECFE